MTVRNALLMLRRRKWLLLQAALILPLAAVGLSYTQPALYEASAQVLLSPQSIASTLTGVPDPGRYQEAQRVAETQAAIARVPVVAERALRRAGLERELTPHRLLATSKVIAQRNADLLEFRVRHADGAVAERLATAYAREFAGYRRELDTDAIVRAREEVEGLLARLADDGKRDSTLYATLVEKQQQLRTMEVLETSNAHVLREADRARQVQPTPVRNGVLGLLLGLVLGVGIAVLRESVDTRVRSAEEVAERLGLPLLARVPDRRRGLRNADPVSMLNRPSGAEAEAYRMLRTNLDFLSLEGEFRTILITSAFQQEGKSTTAANLAAALARAGKRVVLVDLDLRRPSVHRLFGLRHGFGITHVALGRFRLKTVLDEIPVTASRRRRGLLRRAGDPEPLEEEMIGRLEVLPAGALPPNPGEFVRTEALSNVLDEVLERADVVILDAPPALQVGDAAVLSARADAVLVVARANVTRRPALAELRRALETWPSRTLGFVLTGAGADESYEYYGEYYASHPGPTLAPTRQAAA